MLFILLAVICSTGVSQILKFAGHKNFSVKSIFLVNYLVASASAGIRADFATLPRGPGAPVFYMTAGILGLLYIGAFYIYQISLIRSGMYLSTTVSRLSTGLPLAGSLLLFNEPLTAVRAAGLLLMFSSIPLSVPSRSRGAPRRKASVWIILLFFAFGINDFILKIVKELWPGADESAFLLIVFATSALAALVLLAAHREAPTPGALLPGLILGLFNLGSALFVMKALAALPALVAYPAVSLGIILMGIATGVMLWGERLTPRHLAFTLMAGASLFLIR